jgi:hypothetical protein
LKEIANVSRTSSFAIKPVRRERPNCHCRLKGKIAEINSPIIFPKL